MNSNTTEEYCESENTPNTTKNISICVDSVNTKGKAKDTNKCHYCREYPIAPTMVPLHTITYTTGMVRSVTISDCGKPTNQTKKCHFCREYPIPPTMVTLNAIISKSRTIK